MLYCFFFFLQMKRKDSKEPDRERSRNNSHSSTRKSSLPKSTGHRVERKADILTFDQIRVSLSLSNNPVL